MHIFKEILYILAQKNKHGAIAEKLKEIQKIKYHLVILKIRVFSYWLYITRSILFLNNSERNCNKCMHINLFIFFMCLFCFVCFCLVISFASSMWLINLSRFSGGVISCRKSLSDPRKVRPLCANTTPVVYPCYTSWCLN